jgi:hypothetical protein
MTSKQELMNMIDELSEDQLQKVIDYIRLMLFQKEKEEEIQLSEEQKRLLELLDYTIDTDRGDFAEKHDSYLYGTSE